MVAAGLLTRRFVASLLMVDFPNPVFSARRSSLLRHVPETVKLVAGGPDLSEQIANAILAAGAQLPDGSPEHEFTANWQLAEDAWAPTFERRIERYFDLVTRQLATAAGFEAYVRLAESRRREVRSLPLAESKLLLPVTNIPSDALSLQMSPEGTVVPR